MDIQDIIIILRLQTGCLCFTMAIAIPFFIVKRKVNFANRLFKYMIVTQIASLFFDMITVYTVNNLESVHPFLNKLLHIVFISSLCLFVYLTFLYIRHLITDDSRKTRLIAFGAPMFISMLTAAVLPLHYVETGRGNYSAGQGVTMLYISISLYLMMTIYYLLRYWRKIDGTKHKIVLLAMLTQVTFSVIQLFLPTLLISGLGTTIITLAIYLTIENPDRILKEIYLEEKLSTEDANKKLEQIAYIDMLTEILNRRQFMSLAAAQIDRIKRQSGSAYIIMFDIDHFKKVNDTYGHLVGDKVLKCTVDRVREAIRPYDLFGRYGGEEFIIFASDINDADIKKYTERIRTAICGSPMEFEEAQLTVSASLGVAPVDSANHLEEIIDNADKALYTAKHEGRNRVVFMAD